MEPRLSIGMAVHSDFDGPMFTMLSILMTQEGPFEFVVADNSPGKPTSDDLRRFIATIQGNPRCKVKYLPVVAKEGTAYPRNEAIVHASSPRVVVCDSHVMFPGQPMVDRPVLDRMADWWDANPNCRDLIQGPIMLYNLTQLHTHFDDGWGGGMWGKWGQAWRCGCDPERSTKFSPREVDGQIVYKSMSWPAVDVRICGHCEMAIPTGLTNANYRQRLLEYGYLRMGYEDRETPFEIPGQGFGLFSTLRDAWIPFNPRFAEFGGEEMVHHEAYRQAERRCICLPWFQYAHRFARNGGVQYPLSTIGKLRNYVIGFQQLGLDPAPLRDHFLSPEPKRKPVAPAVYDALWENPDRPREDLTAMQQAHDGGASVQVPVLTEVAPSVPEFESHTALREYYQRIPRDLEQHFDGLAEWLKDCRHVTEITGRKESTIALTGCPDVRTLVSYTKEPHAALDNLAKVWDGELVLHRGKGSMDLESIDETDFLFIDTVHTYARLKDELMRFGPKVRRIIAMHDTQKYGFRGEDGQKPGMMTAIREFVLSQMDAERQWTVVKHYEHQHGLTILSCRPEHKRQFPSMVEAAGNLAGAIGRYIKTAGHEVELPIYACRIRACAGCDNLNGAQCGICRCYVQTKARKVAERCPIRRWDESEAEGIEKEELEALMSQVENAPKGE